MKKLTSILLSVVVFANIVCGAPAVPVVSWVLDKIEWIQDGPSTWKSAQNEMLTVNKNVHGGGGRSFAS